MMFFAQFRTNREEISIWSDFTRRIRYLLCLSVFRKFSTYAPGISEPPWQITRPKIRKFADFRFFSRFSVFQAVLTSNFGEIPVVTAVCQTNKKSWVVHAYSSEFYWDPVTKKPRTRRYV